MKIITQENDDYNLMFCVLKKASFPALPDCLNSVLIKILIDIENVYISQKIVVFGNTKSYQRRQLV